jgi:hypothetical protein
VILIAEPKGALEMDACYGPGVNSVCAGTIFALGANLGWLVEWEPATETGKLSASRVEHEAFL